MSEEGNEVGGAEDNSGRDPQHMLEYLSDEEIVEEFRRAYDEVHSDLSFLMRALGS